jgi:hypothetical protein
MALIVPPNRDRTIENIRERSASFLPSEFVQLFFQLPIRSRLQKLSLKGMRYLNDIYDTDAQHTLFMSGRQVAKSTTIGNKMLSYSVLQAHFKSLYVSPSQMQTGQFSNDRIKLPLYYSPHLNAFVNSTLIDRVSHRQFVNGSEIRLRYAFLNADRIRGVMTDLLTIDEFQDILIKLLPVIEETLFTSQYKLKCYAGTPKSADNALAYYWENYSTQNDWMVPCDHGSLHPNGKRVWNQIGEANIPKKSEDGLVCASCRKSIHSMHPNSQWVAANPTPRYSDGRALEIPFQGFRIPQLIYPNVDWKTLINNYNQYPRQQFFNEVLGLPYDSGLRPLTKKQIQEWCDPEASITDGPFPKNLKWARGAISDTFLGVDWGTGENSYTYAVVLGLYNGKIRILYYKKFTGSEVEPDRQIAAIQAIVSQFDVKIIGADYGGGFDRNYHLTKLYGMARVVKYQYVGEHKKKINWDGQLGRYLLRRSEVMADVFEAVKKGAFVFPRWEEMDQSLAKEMLSIFSEYNETRRMTTYGHAPGAPDDGFHALLYAFLALALRHNQSDVLMPYIT